MTHRRIGAVTAAADRIALGLPPVAARTAARARVPVAAPAPTPHRQKIKIGTKFDQPGLGLKKGTEMSGFDVDVATYVAKELGSNAGDIEWVQAVSAQRRDPALLRPVDMIVATYSITDKRARSGFPSPVRCFIAGPGPARPRRRSAIKGKADLDGKKLCSVKGSTPAQKVKDEIPGVNLVTTSGVRSRPGLPRPSTRSRPTTRSSPASQPGTSSGQTQGRRPDLLHGELRHRPEEGRHRDVTKVTGTRSTR